MSRRKVNLSLYVSRYAQPFAIQMPLRCRLSGEREWLDARTENISRSGVLFLASGLMDVNAPIEMSFVLPVEVGGRPGAMVLCQGQVVRTILPAMTDDSPAMAAKILNYRLSVGPETSEAESDE
jgi:hypothetical protein